MQIVPLADRKEHILELAQLHHEEWKHLSPSLTLDQRVEVIANAAGREGIPSIFIATSGNLLLGSAALVLRDMKTRPELSPWLAAVYVKEEFRGRGIATALISRCETEAVRAGASTWYLFTEFASKLYSKLGWVSMESCDYGGVMVHVMYKDIAPEQLQDVRA